MKGCNRNVISAVALKSRIQFEGKPADSLLIFRLPLPGMDQMTLSAPSSPLFVGVCIICFHGNDCINSSSAAVAGDV